MRERAGNLSCLNIHILYAHEYSRAGFTARKVNKIVSNIGNSKHNSK